MGELKWRKSARSGNGGNTCVELARIAGGVAARDSKAPESGMLRFSPAVFGAFLADIKRGAHHL